MPILPLSELTAMTIRDAKAITTSLTRAEGLAAEGYTFSRNASLGRVIVEVQGKPTTHKSRKSGETYIDPHGPYSVDIAVGTCTCPAFANRGACPHVLAAREFNESWEAGKSVPVRQVRIEGLIALREIDGDRYQCRAGRVVIFRNWERAAAYWEAEGLVEHCELVAADMAELQGAGKYAGVCLVTATGEHAIDFGQGSYQA